ncbi:MAG: 50S ribosomal protein L35 [Pseudobdellovibrionaceae bacterium]
MKQKTHSGAKKRLRLLPGGKVKRKQCGMRHLNSHMSSKTKRQNGKTAYIDEGFMYQISRTLVF